jgi:negative regulator of replication initiation
MKHFKIYIIVWFFLVACSASSKRKSADYYKENKEAINKLRNLYDTLYQHQPFSAGFSDKSFQYYLVEVTTDTLRYVYNTEKNKPQVSQVISKFQYDTAMLRELADRLKAIKCLWLSRSSFYVDEKRETVTFLSFKSALTDKPFVENKYYILIFLPYPITSPDINAKVNKGSLVKIDELVYFMIGTKFR